MDTGLLIARLVFGLLMAVHGFQKLFGWFGGPGMSGTASFLEGLGFRPGRLFAVANALELQVWFMAEHVVDVPLAHAV
jgi:putative oxidoreductase